MLNGGAMNKKVLSDLFMPLISIVVSFTIMALGKYNIFDEAYINFGFAFVIVSIIWLLYTMFQIKKSWEAKATKLLKDVSDYVSANCDNSFQCSKVPSGIKYKEYKRYSVKGPLQVVGAINHKEFVFRIVDIYEIIQEGDLNRYDYEFEGYTLQWNDKAGEEFSHIKYYPHKGIDDFDIKKILEEIKDILA